MIIRPDDLINSLRGEFIARNDVLQSYGNAISTFQTLPGLVGFWPMSSVQRSTGNVYDLSGQSRTLTYNGNPTFGLHNNIVPYIALDGTGDSLSRADEIDLDISFAEGWTAAPGLTVGGYFYFDNTASAVEYMASKDLGSGTNRTFRLARAATGYLNAIAWDSSDTLFQLTATDLGVLTTATWYFVVFRVGPSAMALQLNGASQAKASTFPASLKNSTAPLEFGILNTSALPMTGRLSQLFLCATYIPDALINLLFQQTRFLFGV